MIKSIIRSELLIDDNNTMWHHQYKQTRLFGMPIRTEEMYSDEQDHIELHHFSSLNAYQGDKIGFKTSSKIDIEENIEE